MLSFPTTPRATAFRAPVGHLLALVRDHNGSMARGTNDRSRRRPAMPLGDLATAQVNRVDGTETLFGRAEQQRVFISSEMASGALAAERLLPLTR